VTPGTIYYYVVTTVEPNGVESPHTGEAEITP
jgi:hypothetical protein